MKRRFSWSILVGGLAMLLSTVSTSAAQPYRIDLYFARGYERQVDGRTCTAASVAMMVNFIARRDVGLSQLGILRYEQRYDALNNRYQRGSDPLGWSRAVTRYSALAGRRTTYQWAAFGSKMAALKAAALSIAITRRPVGLTVWNGRHAVVMTGFVANRDPRLGKFTLNSIYVSDPLGIHHGRWTPAAFAFGRYLQRDATATYDRLWYGKWVIVRPQTTAPLPIPTPAPTPTPTPTPTEEPTPEPDSTPATEATAEPTPTTEPTPTAEPTPTTEPTPTETPAP